MNSETIVSTLNRLNQDKVIQSLIAQSNARYILLNTSEDSANYPPYTIVDCNLDILALHYLNLGCCLAENQQLAEAIAPLEKGAGILEAVHAPRSNKKSTSNYYGIIAAMSYYVSFQYSKSFILITKFELTTLIAKLIRYFILRNFSELESAVYEIVVSEDYTDDSISQNAEDEGNARIFELVIAKSLDAFVKYLQSGERAFIERARYLLENMKEIAAIEGDPGIWWVIRLLLLITDGFDAASLWTVLSRHFDIDNEQIRNYIRALVFMEPRGIYELFLSQRGSLPKVLNTEHSGCIVSIPTSAGKTRIAEIAILHCLNQNPATKVLYVAPFRSLAFEIENGLEQVFGPSGIVVSHLYGSSLYSKLDEMAINDAKVIIATPEKAKAILRSNKEIAAQIGLAIIDEGHLLGVNKRLIMNEIFYEELKYFVKQNSGRFLVLSAVLPNADDIAEWLTDSAETVYRVNWRPSDERIGILEWNNNAVNLNWESQDAERASFNRRFIVAEKLPLTGKQRVQRYFPGNKNDAVAATAYKLRTFGPVLIFVGRKDSVFVMAESYLNVLDREVPDYQWRNKADWRAFELACTEAYGNGNNWLTFARKGILCHNADLHADVRLPLERLMRTDKPLVIISTSTLGQGVNLGVSTVIFSTLYQSGTEINARDFWNIAGRAGRAFVDHEGKILVALNTNGWKRPYRDLRIKKIRKAFFDKEKIDLAQSGVLSLIEQLKKLADKIGMNFQLLLQLITENRIDEIGEDATEIDSVLDWIDDSLLSLLLVHNPDGELDISWTEAFFRKSLAAIQASNSRVLTADEVIEFMTARITGIAGKIGNDRKKWASIVQSGIPLNSDLLLEQKLPQIIEKVQFYLFLGATLDLKITLLQEIEALIGDLPVLNDNGDFLKLKDIDTIRTRWLTAVPISEIAPIPGGLDVITNMYTFSLPWVLNGIGKKMRNLELEQEAEVVEELSILVETGLPSLDKVKIYQAGIRSRAAANELGNLDALSFGNESIADYKRDLVANAELYKGSVSPATSEWLDLLVRYSGRKITRIKRVPRFSFGTVHEKTQRLIARRIDGKQYLMSPDLSFIQEDDGNVDFSQVNNVLGIEFYYSPEAKKWLMSNDNPYVQITR